MFVPGIRPDIVILNWLLVLPFFAALCAELFPRLTLRVSTEREAAAMRRGPFYLGAVASAMGLVLCAALLPVAASGTGASADYRWTEALFQLRFRADALSIAVALAVHALALLVFFHLLALPEEGDAHHRGALVLVAQGSAAAAALSSDLILLLIFLELAVVSLWLLSSLDSRPAADRFLPTLHLGTLLLTAGVLIMWKAATTSSISDLPLLLFAREAPVLRAMGLLILVGLLPRIACLPGHGWAPALAAARPAAGMAAVVLTLPVGCYALLRLLPGSLVIPLVPALPGVALVIGLAALWWGALRTWLSRELRQVAAWATVAQSGYMVIAIATSPAPGGIARLADGLHAAALHSLLAPLALAAVGGAAVSVLIRARTDSLAGLSGLARRMPIEAAAFLLGGLSIAGVPPLPGFWVQKLLVSCLLALRQPGLATALVVADALLAFAILDAFRQAFLRPQPPPELHPISPWAPTQLALAIVGLAGCSAFMGFLLRWSEVVFRTALTLAR